MPSRSASAGAPPACRPITATALRPLTARAAGPLKGNVRVPGDKSISHRALMFGALATGVTRLTGLLEAEDVLNTAKALQALGAPIEKVGDEWRITGRGVGGLRQPDGPLDFGNSGTGTRLMLGVIAGHDMTVQIEGDASLSRRPMGRVLGPLQQMGLEVEGGRDRLPLIVRGSANLVPIEYALPVPSAQVKSAVLLAGLLTAGETTVIETEATRDHTERMLRYFGAEVRAEAIDGKTRITVTGDARASGPRRRGAGRSELGGVRCRRGGAGARLRRHHRRRARQSDAHRLLRGAARNGRRHCRSPACARRAASRSPTFACATRR